MVQCVRVLPFCLIISVSLSTNALAVVIFDTNINFDEVAFPTANTSISGTNRYNVLNDNTGAELDVLNGDLDDISISVTGSYQYQLTTEGRFSSMETFGSMVLENNPGTRVTNTLELHFADHLSVTEFSFDAASLNSRGFAYEATILQILREDGTLYNQAPIIEPYLEHTAIDGLHNVGVYVFDSTDGVLNVGEDATSRGANHPNENFTITGDLDLSDFGITSGAAIGGLLITTIYEDTRGINNNATSISSSFTDFTFAGEIVPEPTSSALLLLGGAIATLRRSRKVIGA